MVNYYPAALDATFSALADPTRRAILARLAQGESSVSTLAEPFAVSLPAISKHLRVLESAGLVVRKKDGRVHRCRLIAEPMREAAAWIEHYRCFWETQLNALENYLERSQEREKKQWRQHKRVPKQGSKSGGRSRRRAKESSARGRNEKP
jgi:DNA-binding transcriptional ArsR family regulator